MARLKKEDHARILALVEDEHRPVREIAVEYGVTPAAVYALLNRLRQPAAGEDGEGVRQAPLTLDAAALPPRAEPEVAPEPAEPEPAQPEQVASEPLPAALPSQIISFSAPLAPRPHSEPPGKARGIGVLRARGGVGLVTRTADGEETTMPFRSLDDLLSAIKPILREGARSSDPVWFSIQPVDLSEIDMDAA